MNMNTSTKVLMLGWEYPPHISGGLGTACEGLTTALAPLGVSIDFVVPALFGVENAPHMRLVDPGNRILSPERDEDARESGDRRAARIAAGHEDIDRVKPVAQPAEIHAVRIPAMLSPYLSAEQYEQWLQMMEPPSEAPRLTPASAAHHKVAQPELMLHHAEAAAHYGNDLFAEVVRYAGRVTHWAARSQRPDVVHAHDWMTFPAGTRAARLLGVPLVTHVHSLEQDRSGEGANPAIVAIEGAGLKCADRVIAVSHYTARRIHDVHGIPLDRIDVVHNGVYARPTVSAYRGEHPQQGPLVLFLGRVTYQKGPDYFVEAAAKVLQKVPNARFVMAGSGDMLPRMQARVRELGIESSFDFPGFVRGADVEYLFSIADVYVMPSVSEPFGISALEAMSYETPVILSRQSGAAELLRHALKVDFWDIGRLASQIVSVLTYPELKKSIVDMAREEVRRVHWEAAAQKVRSVYTKVCQGG
jgi:glycosyltransferase involved in cell wall biosynthesis